MSTASDRADLPRGGGKDRGLSKLHYVVEQTFGPLRQFRRLTGGCGGIQRIFRCRMVYCGYPPLTQGLYLVKFDKGDDQPVEARSEAAGR